MAWLGVSRWGWRLGVGSAAAWMALAACAQGVGSDDNDLSESKGSGPTSGPGGAGGIGGGAATTVGTGGGGGTLPPCDEAPCKLTSPQCGCASGEKCTLTGSSTRLCKADGTLVAGEACSLNNDQCTAGSMCLSLGGLSSCFKFCSSDMECSGGPGAKCLLEINGGAGDQFCTTNCDPMSGAGCTLPGSKCEPGGTQDAVPSWFTVCVGAGAMTQGQLCSDSQDCASGYNCFSVNDGMTTTDQCLRWCDVNSASPNCPSPTTCQSLPTPILIGPINYGACL